MKISLLMSALLLSSCAAKYESFTSGDKQPDAELLAIAASDLISTYEKANGKDENVVLHSAKNDRTLGPVLESELRQSGFSVETNNPAVSFQNPFIEPHVVDTEGAVDLGYRASFIDDVGTFCLREVGTDKQVCRMYVDGKPASAITIRGLAVETESETAPVKQRIKARTGEPQLANKVSVPAVEVPAVRVVKRAATPAQAVTPPMMQETGKGRVNVLPKTRVESVIEPRMADTISMVEDKPVMKAERLPQEPMVDRTPGADNPYPDGIRIALTDDLMEGEDALLQEQYGKEVAVTARPKKELNLIQTKNLSIDELSDTVAYYKGLLPEGSGNSIVIERKGGESDPAYRHRLLRHLNLVYAYQFYLGVGYE